MFIFLSLGYLASVFSLFFFSIFWNFFIESLGVSHHAPQFCSSPSPSYPLSIPVASPSPTEESKISKQKQEQQQQQNPNKPKQNKNHIRNRKISTLLSSWLSVTSSSVLMTLGTLMCHIVYSFVSTPLLMNSCGIICCCVLLCIVLLQTSSDWSTFWGTELLGRNCLNLFFYRVMFSLFWWLWLIVFAGYGSLGCG